MGFSPKIYPANAFLPQLLHSALPSFVNETQWCLMNVLSVFGISSFWSSPDKINFYISPRSLGPTALSVINGQKISGKSSISVCPHA